MSSTSAMMNARIGELEDDDATPHGSVENIPNMPADDEVDTATDRGVRMRVTPGSSILTRSTSMSTSTPGAGMYAASPASFGGRDQFARRSLTMSSSTKGVSFAPTATVMNEDGSGSLYKKVSTHHVIPVSGGQKQAARVRPTQHEEKMSPEGEIYGFGVKFKENTRQYFTLQQQYPTATAMMSQEAVQNQIFLDQLSAKLTGSLNGPSSITAASVPSSGPSSLPPMIPQTTAAANSASKSRRSAEIESAAQNLRRTTSVNDRSAPKLQ